MASPGYYTSMLNIIRGCAWVLVLTMCARRAWDGSITRCTNPNLISYCSSRLFASSSLGCVTDCLTGALLTTSLLCNNRLVIDWRRCAWKYEQLRKTLLYVPLCSFMVGTRAFAIFLISVHKSFMIEVLE